MNKLYLLPLALTLTAGAAMAGPKCSAPKDQWLNETTFKQDLETQGYKIKTFKISNGCYEIYGHDKAGKRVEIYFDPVSGKPLESH